MSNALGRVLDPDAVAASEGRRARLRIDVPDAWLDEGVDLVVTAPARLTCARCDGGGCDACDRSGVLRAPADVEARVVRARLGPDLGARGAVTLRIVRPFGAGGEIEQLYLEVHAGEAASACVSRVSHEADPSVEMVVPAARLPARWPAMLVALAAVATVIFELLHR